MKEGVEELAPLSYKVAPCTHDIISNVPTSNTINRHDVSLLHHELHNLCNICDRLCENRPCLHLVVIRETLV